MRRNLWILFCFLTCYGAIKGQTNADDSNLKLWYKQPAKIWEEALTLGNAKTGAMVFGGVSRERFQLNDNPLWSGYPNPGNTPEGPSILPQIRKQIFAGNYDSATIL